jgi:dolichol-phosphate mannosyltransferase
MLPADDDFNAPILDQMVALARQGCDIICASRFMPGGKMVGCPWLKALLVRAGAFTLHHFARLPTHDASSGFRLFSRRVIDRIEIESDQGFCYSIELLVKAHRLGWRIGEVPAAWYERKHGTSRFRVLKWLPAYLRWYLYAFATTYLRRPSSTVTMKPARI